MRPRSPRRVRFKPWGSDWELCWSPNTNAARTDAWLQSSGRPLQVPVGDHSRDGGVEATMTAPAWVLQKPELDPLDRRLNLRKATLAGWSHSSTPEAVFTVIPIITVLRTASWGCRSLTRSGV